MTRSKKAMLAAGLIAGATALTGCTASTKPASTAAPAVQQDTAAPAESAQVQQTEEPAEESPGPLALSVSGKDIGAGAALQEERLFLPLIDTAEALGWKADAKEQTEENAVSRTITLEKDGSRIIVSWTTSDNTIKGITWQKDGLLIPVDTRIKSVGEVIYVPAALFEEAMSVNIGRTDGAVLVTSPEPQETKAADGAA